VPETPAEEALPGDASTSAEPETQEERAMRALQAIWGGADLTEEAMTLSNEYTDRHAGRLAAWVRRLVLRQK